ncbi:hypothetical protein ACP70R_010579 [Stipagrostis hirtigluma subsp. patula]
MPSRTSATQLLQGPRPAPLKVAKDSHTAAKRRPVQPVIIYVESPKVVHAHPGEFMAVVQRLTGAAPPPAAPSPSATMLFPVPALPPPPQFPFQLYGTAQEARNDDDGSCMMLPPLAAASTLPPITGRSPFASLPGDAAGRGGLSFFGNDRLSSPFLQLDQSMAPAGPSSVQANLPVSCNPLVLPSLGACYGDLFISQ